ncbi:MalY/PatB family protein [Glycomyces tenuis]|uniref:MalY/PatB family protein n=2 Tax=Glycomyces tenuis TaxID=58116 RepID=UPI0004799386|nr:aminotransferase class I/II-fold pyridoxal phosphate-dependent enzyme [Glycomyces tenuis]
MNGDPTAPPNPLEALPLPQLRRRTSAKWREHPADVLPLWVAEMDVPLAAPIAEALHRAIDLGDTGYSAGEEYAHALARFASDRWRWRDFPTERTAVVPDVMMGVIEVLRLVTGPGDAVVVNSPVYPPFYAFVSHSGRRVVESPLTAEGRIDLDHLGDTFARVGAAHDRAAYLLCNPHNPTGAVHTRAELEAVAALARRHGVRVVADEIHAPLVLPGAVFTPYLTVPGAEDAFSLTSASKAWNLAGLKAAVAVAGAEAAADLRRMPEEVGHGPSHLGVIAHTAAFGEGGAWLDALLGALDGQRALLGRLIAEHLPQLGYLRPEGTYLAWLDCRALGVEEAPLDGIGIVSDLDGPARMFLDRARVALSSGHVFGTGGAGHVRLNFATSAAVLTEAVARMGRAAEERVERP